MQLYRVQAIVINSYQMRDAHRILTLYSREQGKLKVVAHGVDKPASKKRGAVQPFCFSDFLLRRGRELDTVSQCEGLEIFPALWGDLELMSYAGHAAGLVDRLTEEGEPDVRIFKLLLSFLRSFDKMKNPELLVRCFELRLTSMLGYLPYLDGCTNCGSADLGRDTFFSAESGGLVCGECKQSAEGDPFCGGEAVSVMKALLDWDFTKIDRLRVSPLAAAQIKLVLSCHLKWLTERRSGSLEFLEKVRDYIPK